MVVLIITLLPLNSANASHIKYSGYGWFSTFSRFMGNDSSTCGPNQTVFDVSLREGDSNSAVTDVPFWWDITVYSDLNFSSYVVYEMSPGTRTSPKFCYDPYNQRIAIDTYNDSSSLYHPLNTPAVYLEYLGGTVYGKYYRHYAHLKRKSDPDGTLVANFPDVGVILWYDPAYSILTNEIASLYNADDLLDTNLSLYSYNTDSSQTVEIITSDQYSGSLPTTVTMPAQGITEDGWYSWTTNHQLNGEYTVSNGDYFNESPWSASIYWTDFIFDQTPPDSSLSLVINSSDETGVNATLNNTVQDVLAGTDFTTIYINETSPGTDTASVTTEIVPRYGEDEYLISTDITLKPGSTYEYFAVTKDAAYNYTTTTVQTYTVPSLPEVINPTYSNVTTNSADLGATINSDGGSVITEAGTCWDVDVNFSSENCDIAPGAALYTPYTLTPSVSMPTDTTIFFRGYAKNIAGTGYSTTTSFKTIGLGPIINNQGADNLGLDTANLRANITSENGSSIQKHGFCWNEGSSYDTSAGSHNCIHFGSGGTGSFSHVLNSLTSDTSYTYVAYAENAAASATTSASTFTTLELPTVSISPADNLSGNGADLNATLNDNGSSPVFSHGFCWNEGSSYDSSIDDCTPDLGSISSGSDYSLALAPLLSPNTTYSFIAYVESVAGKVETGELQFTTTSPVPTITLTATPSSINLGYPTNITWSSTDADTCTGTNFSTGVGNDTDGSVSDSPSSNTTYRIDCTGSGGSAFETVTVNVNTGPPVLTDPELKLSAQTNIIRAHGSTQLDWTMANVGEPLDCRITGPSSLATNPDATFTHPPTPQSADPEITGSINSGTLSSTQTFTFTCEDAISSVVYSTSTEVKVVGNPYEI